MSAIRHVAFVGNGGPHLHYWGKLLADSRIQVDLVATRPFPTAWNYGETLVRWTGPEAGYWSQLSNLRRAIRPLRKTRGVQLIHSHYLGKPTWIASCGALPVVASAWGTDISPTGNEFSRWWIRYLTLRALNRVAAVTAHSPELIARLRQIGQPDDKLHLVPWGIDRLVFNCDPPRLPWRARLDLGSGPAILSLRASGPNYQTREIVRAFAAIAAEFRDAVLILRDYASPNSDAPVVRAELEALGLAERIRWVGWIEDRRDMADLYRSCDIGISYPVQDGYPLSVQEAMCCGLVPVVSRLATTKNLVQHGFNGLVVDPSDPHELTEALRQLLADDDMRRRLREALASYAGRMITPAESRDGLLEVYARMITCNARG